MNQKKKSIKTFLFFILLIVFITQPVLGNTQNITEVNVDHQISYDIFMDDETGTYSANVASFLTIYSTDTIKFINATVEIIIFKIDSDGVHAYEEPHLIHYDKKVNLNRNNTKLLAHNFIVKNISYSYDPNLGESIAIPYQTYKIVLYEGINKTILKTNPTRVKIGLPYDDYNYSEFIYSSIPEEDVYTEGKRVTVVLNGIEEYTEYQRPFLLFFITKEDKSKKALDNITMNSNTLWGIGIGIAVLITVIFTYTIPAILKTRFVVSKLSLKEKIAFYTRLKGWVRDFMLFYVLNNKNIDKKILDKKIQEMNNNKHCMSKKILEIYLNVYDGIVTYKDYGPKKDNTELEIMEMYDDFEEKVDKKIKNLRKISLIIHLIVIVFLFISIISQVNSLM